MAQYHFITDAVLSAPADRVWAVVSRPEGYPDVWRWCKQVDVLDPGGPDLLGARHRLHFGTALPYTITVGTEVVRAAPPDVLDLRAGGDLDGVGRWTLRAGAVTAVTYEWLVATTKSWMNVLAPVARPVFAWNHDVLMRDFARGVAAASGGELLRIDNSTVQPDDPAFHQFRPRGDASL